MLEDPDIGGFEVTKLLNCSEAEARVAVARFFSNRTTDDMLLFYFSGHGGAFGRNAKGGVGASYH